MHKCLKSNLSIATSKTDPSVSASCGWIEKLSCGGLSKPTETVKQVEIIFGVFQGQNISSIRK